MDFDDLVKALKPPPNRVGKSEGDHENHLYEGAAMVAYAMHLLRTHPTREVHVYLKQNDPACRIVFGYNDAQGIAATLIGKLCEARNNCDAYRRKND